MIYCRFVECLCECLQNKIRLPLMILIEALLYGLIMVLYEKVHSASCVSQFPILVTNATDICVSVLPSCDNGEDKT